jgi:ribosome-binding protein aMBF1 (putative translation factor)
MDLENLTQYDKPKFKEMFGLYVQETRNAMKWSEQELAKHLNLPVSDIGLIEAGQKTLSQDSFDYLRLSLNLDENEILNIARITQVQMLLEVYREINEQYPK